jgi:hypothetical protein
MADEIKGRWIKDIKIAYGQNQRWIYLPGNDLHSNLKKSNH